MDQLYENLKKWQSNTKSHFYVTPHPLLRRWIAHYTLTLPLLDASQNQGDLEKEGSLAVVPDASGCIVCTLDCDRGWDVSMWGPTTKMVMVKRDGNHVPARFFVEFMPGGLFAVTGWQASELTDRVMQLEDVAPQLKGELLDALEKSVSAEEMIQSFNLSFLKRMDNWKDTGLFSFLYE